MDEGELGAGPQGSDPFATEAVQPMPFVQVNQPIAPRATNRPGTAGGVLGIVGATLFWLPGINLLLALSALIFGLIGLSRGRKEGLPIGMAVTGVVLGALGTISFGAILATLIMIASSV
jgi:hypothetical protein